MKEWYSLSIDGILKELKTFENGLTSEDAAKRLKEYGPNEIQDTQTRSRLNIFFSQFKDVMIIILILAAVVSVVVGEYTDAYVILAIIIGNAIIGYVQENNAEQSIQALKKMAAQYAIVQRDEKSKKVEISELVPGDVILLEAGDIVPADARLIEVYGLKMEEAALTGESESVRKETATIEKKDLLPGDRLNMVFKGTIVSKGNGRAIVTGTGVNTEIGKIAQLLDGESQKTPLQLRLAKFSKILAVIVIVICAVVFGLGMLRGEPVLRMFLTALSLAVAALPEALPAVITIALARGAGRMVKRDALIRKLPAVETLGSVTYICTDKTGTLTQNKMTVTELQAVAGKEDLLLDSMLLNNEVKESAEGTLLGDSTETGIVSYVLGLGRYYKDSIIKYPLESTIPFDSERMLMSTLHKDGDGWLLLVKGAPGRITDRLKNKNIKDEWLNLNKKWAAKGLRVLFFAYKRLGNKPDKLDRNIENDLDLLGAVGMIDPPRDGVLEAVNECKDAGIKVVMITGDQPITAMAIAKELNIADNEQEVMTGVEMKKMGEGELVKHVKSVKVYARVSPEQKVNIVEALQEDGQFVAMTGDGVNDAPSLKKSNIGVAMGLTGTDVAKEAADMILLSDNFATIVNAVKEGRRIYDNIRRFVLYILACNMGEILTILVAPMLGLPIPLLPIHILWINLVTDGLPGLAFANEPVEGNIMKRPPISPKESLFARGVFYHILFTGIILGGFALGAQYWAESQGYDIATQQTVVFSVLCFGQLLNALSVRSVYKPIFAMRLFSNPLMIFSVIGTIALQFGLVYIPFLHPVFKTTSLDADLIGIVIMSSVTALICIELVKWFYYRKAQMKMS